MLRLLGRFLFLSSALSLSPITFAEEGPIEFLHPTAYRHLLRLGILLEAGDPLTIREEKIKSKDVQRLQNVRTFFQLLSDYTLATGEPNKFKDQIEGINSSLTLVAESNSGLLDASRQQGLTTYKLPPGISRDLQKLGSIPQKASQKISWVLAAFDQIWLEMDQLFLDLNPYITWIRSNSEILKSSELSQIEKEKILQGILSRREVFLRQFQIYIRFIENGIAVLKHAEKVFQIPSTYREQLVSLRKSYQVRWNSSGQRIFETEFLALRSLGPQILKNHMALVTHGEERSEGLRAYIRGLTEFAQKWTDSAILVCDTREDFTNLRTPISSAGLRGFLVSFLNSKKGTDGFSPTQLNAALEIVDGLETLGSVVDDSEKIVSGRNPRSLGLSYASSTAFLNLFAADRTLPVWELSRLGRKIWGQPGKKIFFEKVLEVSQTPEEVVEFLKKGLFFSSPLDSPSPDPFFPIDKQVVDELELQSLAFEMELAFVDFVGRLKKNNAEADLKGFARFLGVELREAGWPVFLTGETETSEARMTRGIFHSKRCRFWLSRVLR